MNRRILRAHKKARRRANRQLRTIGLVLVGVAVLIALGIVLTTHTNQTASNAQSFGSTNPMQFPAIPSGPEGPAFTFGKTDLQTICGDICFNTDATWVEQCHYANGVIEERCLIIIPKKGTCRWYNAAPNTTLALWQFDGEPTVLTGMSKYVCGNVAIWKPAVT